MFKRIDKRRKRKEEEEELGIEEEMKEAIGLNDTDSDESASSEDEDEGSESGSEGEGEIEDEDEDEDAGSGDEEGSEDGDEGSDEEDVSGVEPSITIGDALLNPVRASPDGDHSTCIFCPSAILKHEVMVRVHLDSKAHKRRMDKAIELAMPLLPDTDVRVLLKKIDARTVPTPAVKPVVEDEEVKVTESKNGEEKLSRRALKRIKKQQAIAAKRRMGKEARAKKAAKKREVKEDDSEDKASNGGGEARETEKTTTGRAMKEINAAKKIVEESGEAKVVGGEPKKRKRVAGKVNVSAPEKAATDIAADTPTLGLSAKSRGKQPAAESLQSTERLKSQGKAKVRDDVAVAPFAPPITASPKSALQSKKRKAPTAENVEGAKDAKKRKLLKTGTTGKIIKSNGTVKHRAKA